MNAPRRCVAEMGRRGQLQACDRLAKYERVDQSGSGGPRPVCGIHMRARYFADHDRLRHVYGWSPRREEPS
jgi:hypothetical protein